MTQQKFKKQEEQQISTIAIIAVGVAAGAILGFIFYKKVKEALTPVNIDNYQTGSTSIDEKGNLIVNYSDQKLTNKDKGFWNNIQEAGL
jgi:archaellum biogenesis protein FlaJ (TadC family)